MLIKLNNSFMSHPDAYLVSERLQDLIKFYSALDVFEVANNISKYHIDTGIYKYSELTQIKTHLDNLINTYACYNEILSLVFSESILVKKSS